MNNMMSKAIVESEKIQYVPKKRMHLWKVKRKAKHSDTDSEKSYQQLFTKEEFLDCLVNLNFHMNWLFYTILANTLNYCLLTYSMVFDNHILQYPVVYSLVIICYVILLVDAVTIILHYNMKKIQERVPYGRIHIGFVVVQGMSLMSMPVRVFLLVGSYPSGNFVYLSLLILRFYKLIFYIHILNSVPLQMKIRNLFRKYLLIFMLIIHSAACVWMVLGCLEPSAICEAKNYGPETYWNKARHYNVILEYGNSSVISLRREELYVLCIYYSLGGLVTIGFGGASMKNDKEMLFCIATMCLFMLIVNGMFLAEFTAHRIYTQAYDSKTAYGILMIENDLLSSRIHSDLKHKIIKYLNDFLAKENFVRKSNMLMVLPETIVGDFRMEKYWNAITTCKIFDETSEAFKRELAHAMTYEMYNTGDVLYEIGKEANAMYFIAHGNIQVLSGEDGESPIIFLGMGSSIGQMYLLYSIKPRFKVSVASYTIVYILHKKAFWKAVNVCYKLKQCPLLHKAFYANIEYARQLQTDRLNAPKTKSDRKWKCVDSKKILAVFKEKMKSQSKDKSSDRARANYMFSRINDDQSFDDIFLTTTWPWILHPQSPFLKVWDKCNFVVLVYVAIYCPYVIGFLSTNTSVKRLLTSEAVCVFYFFDIVVQIFTAIETRNGLCWRIYDILWVRIEKVTFILDLLAGVPFHWALLFMSIEDEAGSAFKYFSLNRLLKLYKVHFLFAGFERSCKKYVYLIKGFKYCLYLLYLAYLLGTMYYISSCYSQDHCNTYSWAQRVKDILVRSPHYTDENDPMKYMPIYSFLYMLYIVTNTCRCLTVNLKELILMLVFAVVGKLVFSYLVSEYCGNLTLTKYYEVQQYEFVKTVRKYMAYNNMPKHLRNRVLYNFNSLLNIYEEKKKVSLYEHCPSYLFELIQIGKYSRVVRQIQLFKDLNEHIIHMLAIKCTELRLPPNEYVVYSGECSRNIYFIQEGYCRIVEGSVSQKVLGPNSVINVIETVLGVDSLVTICAQSYTTLVILKSKHLNKIFSMHPGMKEDIMACMDEMALKRGFNRVGDLVTSSFDMKEHVASWFYFPRARRNPLNIDYKNAYEKSNWRILRYVLMRHTALPDGNFLKYWEIFRAICSLLIGFIGPSSFIYMHYFPWTEYLLWFLYFVGFADMYIRLHECYYNCKGILVTHPLYTAEYYVTHGFLMDMLGVMPFYVIMSALANTERPKLTLSLKFNVLLQLNRFLNAFSNKKIGAYSVEPVFYRALKCIPLSLVIFNAFSCALMLISGDVTDRNGMWMVTRKNFSYINMNRKYTNFDIEELYNFYIVSVYWTVSSSLALGFVQWHPVTANEILFKIVTLVSGYLFVMYHLVFIAHSRFVANQQLTMYQNYMNQLIIYMKKENIPKGTQTKVISHFEHLWRMTNGVESSKIANIFHIPLKTDFVLQLYEATLQHVPAFADSSRSFFRIIGMHMGECYLRQNVSVMSLNDIINTIYIVHKGDVTVYGPANTPLAVLGNGSMFGNIDDIESTRCMVTVVTNSTTDLLTIDSKLFYDLIQAFPIIKAHMERHILLENLSYMKSSVVSYECFDVEFVEKRRDLHPMIRFFTQRYFFAIMVFLSLASCWLASYQVAFDKRGILYYFLYFFDMLHILKIIINLHTPFYNNRGDLVTDRHQIKKRYMVPMKFYFDCLTIFPFEVLCFLFKENRERYRMMIGSYRILRGFNVYQFFEVYENKLNTSAPLVRIGGVLTYSFIFIHLCACIAYSYACPLYNCNVDHWMFSHRQNHTLLCNDEYICSIYYILSIFTTTGYNDIHPRTRLDFMFCIVVLIASKYFIAVIIGDMTALMRNSLYSLAKYNLEIQIFNARMRNCYVSGPFYDKLIKYFNNLWVVRMGCQIPVLLQDAPHNLLEEINVAAYGHHIYDNLVFASCHKDFLRTLTRMLEVRIFFLGDTICYQEDVNDTMYFIHKGIVDVYTILENEEIHVDQLRELDCFGMVQGLYPRTPHTHTYKSNAVTIILILKFVDWHPLLKFFPASKFEIYRKMNMLERL